MSVLVNPFVTRQTPESPFSHFDYGWDMLRDLAQTGLDNGDTTPGYRDGVILVDVPAMGFHSGVCTLAEGAELTGSYKARRKGETPRKQVLAKGATKIAAKSCQIVLYRSDVLAEDGDNAGDGTADQWEIISVNASPVEGDMPIDPMVLMHNHFGSDGGTATGLSDSELVAMLRDSFGWWKDKAMCG
jgi:hypothetical protein